MRGRTLVAAMAGSAALAATAPAHAQDARCRLSADIYFESGSATLLTSARETLSVLSDQLATCSQPLIIVVAHVDGDESGRVPQIGQQRADAVAGSLRKAMQDTPVLTQDLGFTQPRRATGPDAREPLNRRVTIFVR